MARDLSAYLQDIYDACAAIEEVIEGVTLDDYRGRRAIIDFRNLLTHDYGAVDDDSVFGLVHSDLIVLKAEVGLLPCLFTPCGQVMASVQRIKSMPIVPTCVYPGKAFSPALAQHKIDQLQQGCRRGRHVGEGGGIQYPRHTIGLLLGGHNPRARQHRQRPVGGIEFRGQGDELKHHHGCEHADACPNQQG